MTFTPAARHAKATQFVIPALSFTGYAQGWTSTGTNAYPTVNLAIFVPFSVSLPVTVQEGWVQTGATAGGNFDIGVYDDAGARLTSSGATARVASQINDTTAMTDLELLPDRYYYMAFAADATSNYFGVTPAGGLCEAMGVLTRASSYVLPADASTWIRSATAFIPMFGLNLTAVAI